MPWKSARVYHMPQYTLAAQHLHAYPLIFQIAPELPAHFEQHGLHLAPAKAGALTDVLDGIKIPIPPDILSIFFCKLDVKRHVVLV